MLKACVVCGAPSDQARCPAHRYTRQRGSQARKQRQRIIERDNYQCRYCHRYLNGTDDTHVDHIIPLSKGGDESDMNKQTLCAECNLAKGDA